MEETPRMSGKSVVGATLILLLGACQDRAPDPSTPQGAIEITNDLFASELPQVHLSNFTITSIDLGTRWRIVYEAPEGSTGGPWMVEVEKSTGNIVSAGGGQ
jgi:hypothetical protein